MHEIELITGYWHPLQIYMVMTKSEWGAHQISAYTLKSHYCTGNSSLTRFASKSERPKGDMDRPPQEEAGFSLFVAIPLKMVTFEIYLVPFGSHPGSYL